MSTQRALEGVRVVELANFVAAPCCARFLADQGADVIKIETLGGDAIRYAPLAEGRPVLPDENLTFDIENGNKRGVAMNLKSPKCFEALVRMVSRADVFITNWRPKALERMGLDYPSLKRRFPRLVYACVTGYGEKGPDRDLPGYDFTAFFTRSGILGSLYDKGGAPNNLIPGMGDRQAGMFLAAGVCAALYRAARTGQGEKVSCSLLGAAIFTQGTMIQAAQYGLLEYPLEKRESPNPLTSCFRTGDGRWMQISVPVFDLFPRLADALDLPELKSDPRFASQEAVTDGNGPALYDAIAARFAQLTVAEASEKLAAADLPFALAKVWREVLEDEQAWADDVFTKLSYPSGERVAIRNPVRFEEAGLPGYALAPHVGQHTREVLAELGYGDDEISGMLDAGEIRVTSESYR
ncbi:MAG: CoA transferase [Clostridiales Family XIII bacterium]|jgi:cinnamoyl-CoA:phenyllactate CoA-transferase|nr:CoA transferase [Clostridiales Family XIII bacterium]